MITLNPIFSGASPGMLDYHIFPWFERFPFLKEKRDCNILENCPKLRQWFESMAQDAGVKTTMFDTETHLKFYDMYIAGEQGWDLKLEE